MLVITKSKTKHVLMCEHKLNKNKKNNSIIFIFYNFYTQKRKT